MGFAVMAPADVPGGNSLTLQTKRDDQEEFSSYANSVVANQRVTVTGLTACQHYAVRWQTARTASAWLWVTTSCAEGQAPPARRNWAPAAEAGYIVGQVLDARTNDPLEGVILWAEGYETGSTAEATSDALGRFKLGLLEAGDGYQVIALGEAYSSRSWEDVTVPAQGLVFNASLVRTGAAHGRITTLDETGENEIGVANAELQFWALDEPIGMMATSETDEQGNFCLCILDGSSASDLDKCSYRIVVIHPDYSYAEVTRQIVPRYVAADEAIVDSVLIARRTLEGVVNVDNSPHSGVKVTVRQNLTGSIADALPSVSEQTDAQGKFQFSLSVPATYLLFFQAEGTSTQHIEASVELGDEPQSLEPVNLQGPGNMSVSVTDLADNSITAATVELLDVNGSAELAVSTIPDQDGAFFIFSGAARYLYGLRPNAGRGGIYAISS